jgi:hypothetical protein
MDNYHYAPVRTRTHACTPDVNKFLKKKLKNIFFRQIKVVYSHIPLELQINSMIQSLLITFPSGKIGYELRHYMGIEDPLGHLQERPEIIRIMADRCVPGKTSEFTLQEVAQLIKEVENALDIKQNHIGDEWTNLHHWHMQRFLSKLNNQYASKT